MELVVEHLASIRTSLCILVWVVFASFLCIMGYLLMPYFSILNWILIFAGIFIFALAFIAWSISEVQEVRRKKAEQKTE